MAEDDTRDDERPMDEFPVGRYIREPAQYTVQGETGTRLHHGHGRFRSRQSQARLVVWLLLLLLASPVGQDQPRAGFGARNS